MDATGKVLSTANTNSWDENETELTFPLKTKAAPPGCKVVLSVYGKPTLVKLPFKLTKLDPYGRPRK